MTNLKPIPPDERCVANIDSATFVPFSGNDGDESGEMVLQLNTAKPNGVGFHIYKMAPGAHSVPHEHTGDEEFFVIRGELIDNDGTVYREGDLVWLKKGTQHSSYTKDGCVIAVYIETAETAV